MPILVIALIVVAVFLGIGALLLIAMLFDTERANLSNITPSPQKDDAPHKKQAA